MTDALTQNKWVLAQLKKGRRITPMDAWNEAGCYRLGARIYDLREDGWDIITDVNDAPGEPRYAIYRLNGQKRAA